MIQDLLIDAGPSAPPSVDSDEWYTTAETSEWARACAGVDAWDLDVAACDEAHLAPHYYTKRENGLAREWDAERVWCNPPYSQIAPWVEKAWLEWRDRPYRFTDQRTIAMLLPAVKTEQAWWREHVEPHRDGRGKRVLATHFQLGRAAFAAPGTNGKPVKGSPFGCVLLVWRRQ